MRLSFVRAALVFLASSCAVFGCASAPVGDDVDAFESADQAVTYCVGPNKVEGIDISYWQGASVDWARVRAAGKRFAFLRLSYGAQVGLDSTFRRNWSEAKANGVLRGAYQYFLPAQDATAQANLLVNELGRLGAGDLPAVIDVEQTPNGISPATYAQKVGEWIDIVERGTGKKPIVYTGKYFWNDNVQSSAYLNNPLWLAAYTTGCPDTPRPWTKWTFWQYASTGSVSGISGNVDVNVFDGTLAQLEELAGVTVCVPGAEVCNGQDDDCDGQSDEDDVCESEFAARYASVFAPPSTTDADGDGTADVCGRGPLGVVCKLRTATGFVAGPVAIPWTDAAGFAADGVHQTLRSGDVNGDGRADFCIRGPEGVLCQVSTATGAFASVGGPAWSNASGWRDPKYGNTIRLVDLDGDGRDDICARAAKGVVCHRSTGGGFGAEIAGPAWSDAAGFDRPRTWATLSFADVNGDGRRDACIRSTEGIRCSLFDGAAFAAPILGPGWNDDGGWGDVKYFSTIRFADVDGDGKADVCGRGAAGLRCALSRGNGFGDEILANWMKDADGWNAEKYYATLRVADVNGDGRAELCARGSVGVRCYGYKSGAFAQVLTTTALSDSEGWNVPARYDTMAFGDVNGDGRSDVCARDLDGYTCWPTTTAGSGTGPAEKVAEYTDTLGWDKSVYYASLRLGGPSKQRALGGTDGGLPSDAATDAATDGHAGDASTEPQGATGEPSGCACTITAPVRRRGALGPLAALGVALAVARLRRRAAR